MINKPFIYISKQFPWYFASFKNLKVFFKKKTQDLFLCGFLICIDSLIYNDHVPNHISAYLFFILNFSKVVFSLVSYNTIDLPTAKAYRAIYNYSTTELKFLDPIYIHRKSLGRKPPKPLLVFWFFCLSCC